MVVEGVFGSFTTDRFIVFEREFAKGDPSWCGLGSKFSAAAGVLLVVFHCVSNSGCLALKEGFFCIRRGNWECPAAGLPSAWWAKGSLEESLCCELE